MSGIFSCALEISTKHLRPQDFSGHLGFRFNLYYFTEDGLAKSGDVFMTIKDNQFYAMVFLAATMHYYPKYQVAVDNMFTGATL